MVPRRFFWLFDWCVIIAAFFGAYVVVESLSSILVSDGWVRVFLQALSFPPNWEGHLPPVSDLVWILFLASPVTLLVLGAIGNHDPILEQTRARIVFGGILAPTAGLGLISMALFALKTANSRLFVFSFTMLSALGLILYRFGLRLYCSRRRSLGYYAKNVLFLGSAGAIDWMVDYFKEHVPATEYRPFGYLRIPGDVLPVCGIRYMGDVEELGTLLVNEPIHEVVVVQPFSDGEWITRVLRDCDYFGIVTRIVPEVLLVQHQRFLKVLNPFSPLNVPSLVLASPHWNSEALFFKRVFDVILSAAFLIFLMPVFALIAIAIKLSTPDLPIFYRWRVVGRNGVEFTGFKFTTMNSDADQRKGELSQQNEMQGPVFKIKNDPRTTPLGRFLRKYSLNELPQLWSVLKGDMSLVGPRPAFRHELERYEFWHKRKLSISPGITCLWQIRGRNAISKFDDWVRMDLEYIDSWSLWLDFKILLRTAWVVISGTGS